MLCGGIAGIGGTNVAISGNSVKEKLLLYLTSPHAAGGKLTLEQAAGVAGNVQVESGFNTAAVNSGSGASGLVQWLGDRKKRLMSYSTMKKVDWTDVDLQLHYLGWELGIDELSLSIDKKTPGAEKASWEAIKNTSTPEEAAKVWELRFERSGGASLTERTANAKAIFEEFKNNPSIASKSPATNKSPVVVLDPGHGSSKDFGKDPISGLWDRETSNSPEREQMFNSATQIKSTLEKDGYTVILTKNSATESVSKRERANVANQAKADIAVSLHNDGTRKWGSWGEIYTQKVGLYRGSGPNKTTFTDANLEKRSSAYATKIQETRNKYESGAVKLTDADFAGRDTEPGNIPLVQLYATVPWVYMEAGGKGFDQPSYVKGVTEGIEAAVPVGNDTPETGNSDSSNCTAGEAGSSAVAGDIAGTAKNLAWPYKVEVPRSTSDEPGRRAAKPEYVTTQQKYNGSTGEAVFTDCGVFVSTVMVSSGVDPKYPKRGTSVQLSYLQGNSDYKKIVSSNDIQPGDILILDGHTYLYVGKYHSDKDNQDYSSSAASLHTRPPSASDTYFSDSRGAYSIYRYMGGVSA
jgi:N-acetylmuramoyl-L-alanine amidase